MALPLPVPPMGTTGAVNPFARDGATMGERPRVADASQLARLEDAIRRAHAAGNVDDVRALGAEYRRLQSEGGGAGETVTLNIGGTRVRVGKEFLSLPPEEQNRTVEEIAGQMGASGSATGEGTKQRTYTIQAPDGRKIKVRAGSEADALRGAREWAEANPRGAAGEGGVDLARIKRNVESMVRQNATEAEVDAYIASEGVTVDDVRNFRGDTGEAMPPTGLVPGSREYADWAAEQARAGMALPQVSQHMDGPQELSTQARFDAAIENVRRKYYPWADDAKWQEILERDSRFKPYNAQDLLTHGMTFGLTDEAGALSGAVGNLLTGQDFGEGWADFKELEEARRELGREQAGLLGTGAEVAGSVLSGAPVLKAATGAGSLLSQAARGLTGAGALGAAYGAGATDGGLEERGAGALVGGALGAASGAVAPFLARGVQGAARWFGQRGLNRQAVRAAPTGAAIKRAAKSAFREFENSSAVIKQPALNILRHDMGSAMQSAGIIAPSGRVASSYPRVKDALEALDDFASAPLGMRGANTLYTTIRRAANSSDGGEAVLGGKMLDIFEDWMDSLPMQAITGNADEAFNAWARGKSDWARFKKVQTLELAIDKARRARGGFAAGLRSQFNRILDSAKKQRGFTKAELDAMRKFAEGGTVERLVELATAFKSIPGAAAMFGLSGGNIPLALGAWGAGIGARGAINNSARQFGNVMRAGAALPGGVPQLPPRAPMLPVALPIGASAANPLLDDVRTGTAATLYSRGR